MATAEEIRDVLKSAGWSLGEFATPGGWHVEGTRGEAHIRGEGTTPAVAWHRVALAALLLPADATLRA